MCVGETEGGEGYTATITPSEKKHACVKFVRNNKVVPHIVEKDCFCLATLKNKQTNTNNRV